MAAQRHIDNEVKVTDSLKDSFDDTDKNLFKLGADNIFLGRKAATKEEAIRFAGEQLVKGGYVEPEYAGDAGPRKTDLDLSWQVHRGAARHHRSERPRAENRRRLLPVPGRGALWGR